MRYIGYADGEPSWAKYITIVHTWVHARTHTQREGERDGDQMPHSSDRKMVLKLTKTFQSIKYLNHDILWLKKMVNNYRLYFRKKRYQTFPCLTNFQFIVPN